MNEDTDPSSGPARTSRFRVTRRDAMRLSVGAIAASGVALGASGAARATRARWLEPPATPADIPTDEPIDRSRMTERRLDIDDGEDLSARVAASESGELLVVPAGVYTWTQSVTHSYTDWGIRGEWGEDVRIRVADGWGFSGDPFLVNVDGGDNVLIENLRIDTETRDGRAAPGFRVVVPTAALVHHVFWLHAGVSDAHHATRSRLLLRPNQPDAHVMIDGVVINNRGYVNYHNQGDRLAYSSAPGKLTFRNIKAGGFPDNIIYTRMPGEMVVENCVFANATSFVRVGGDNETVRDCTFWVDTGRDVELYGLDGSSVNMSPISADNMSAASDGGHVESCSFVVREAPHASGVFRFLSNAWLEVRDCQVVMDDPAITGTGQMGYGEEITWIDTDFVTTNDSMAGVAPSLEGTYVTENVHVDEGLVPGQIDPDSREPTFDWDLVHPFPEDGDITLPGDPRDLYDGGIVRSTTFRGENADDLPTEWTAAWGSSADGVAIVADDAASDGRLLEVGASTRRWDAVPSDVADVEAVGKVRLEALDEGAAAKLYVRGGGSAGDESGYAVDLGDDGVRLRSEPTGEVLGTAGSVSADTWYWVRVQARGTTLRVSYWEDGTAQPDEWAIEEADDTHESGWIGVGASSGAVGHWDRFSVGTGDKHARLPMNSPAYVAVEAIDAVRHVRPGEAFEGTVTVTNEGDVTTTADVRYVVDDEIVESWELTLTGGDRRTLSFAHAVEDPGTFAQTIETPHTSNGVALIVEDPDDADSGTDDTGDDEPADDGPTTGDDTDAGIDPDEDDGQADTDDGDSIPGFGIGAAIAGVAGAATLLKRRLEGSDTER